MIDDHKLPDMGVVVELAPVFASVDATLAHAKEEGDIINETRFNGVWLGLCMAITATHGTQTASLAAGLGRELFDKTTEEERSRMVIPHGR
jgi:hypothetical protein